MATEATSSANNIQNQLGKYASYNNLWTFYIPSKVNYNSGDWADIVENVIISSAGRDDAKRVQTIYGRPEYFINNIVMDAIIVSTDSGGNSAQQKIEFDVFEPYSMGLFLQSCQIAAMNAGYPSYLEDTPYVLRLDIVGQTAYTEFSELGPYRFCLKLTKANFTTDESGSTYKVEAIPFGDAPFNTTINTLQSDVKIIGKDAPSVLINDPGHDFVTVLNDREAKLVKDGKKTIPNKYAIEFTPPDWGGENPFADPEKGGSFDFQPESKGGTEVHQRADAVYDNDKVVRERVTIIPTIKTFQYSAKTSITSVIDSVILSTRHARSAGSGQDALDAEGRITWWRIDAEVKLLELDPSTNEYAKLYTYKIVPFKVHHSVFMSPGSGSVGVEAMKKTAAKKYYYIYTGLNTEVLKWNIEIENQFFQAVSGNAPQTTGIQASPGVNNSVAGQIATTDPAEGAAKATSPEAYGSRVAPSSRASKNPVAGGAGVKDTAQRVADEFYIAAFKGLDKLNLELEVQGDPYWLPQAGQPNYASAGNGTAVTGDGTMNHETQDIMIEMIFRTPYDTEGGSGLYKFMDLGLPSPFSGMYKVTTVTSKWNDNHFTQTINGYRIPGQDLTGVEARAPNPIKEWVDEPPTLGGI